MYLTLDTDVLPAAVAPGVSAPAPLGVPLYGDLPSGHGDSNLPWPYGQQAQLSASSLSW